MKGDRVKTTTSMSSKGRSRFAAAMLVLASLTVVPTNPTSAQTLPQEVRIGWQKGAAILVLARKQKVIQKRLESLGVQSVRWVEFQFGPPMLEAMGAGAVDLGSVGDTPPIFAQAGGANVVYAAASPSSQHALLVPKDSPIKTLAGLRGKKVAFGKGSSAHNFVVKALAQANLRLTDIEPVYLSPADATAAFNGGNIDAWAVWDPYYAIAEQRYHARVIANTSDKRLASSSYYLANKDFAAKHSDVLKAVLDELRKLTIQAGRERTRLAATAAEATGIDAAVWRRAFDRAEFNLTPVTEAHIRQQQELANAFHALNVIPHTLRVNEIVWHGLDTQ